jgi:hypothetical protein
VAIIKKYNKENGTTYVYDSVSYWDKEKQQPRSKRKLIGKLDPVTGEIVPTGGRGRKPRNIPNEDSVSLEPAPCQVSVPLPSDFSDSAEYKKLYEETRRIILEKDAAIASLEATVSRLTNETQDLLEKLEKLIREHRH